MSLPLVSREHVCSLSDALLLSRLLDSLASERRAIVCLLLLLGEFDRRGGYHAHGCDSLFSFCRRVLGLCEGAACRRIEAARLLARFPQVEPMLLDGRLCLTTLCLLKPVLSADNADTVFARAAGCSKAEVMELVAALAPRPALRDFIAPLVPRSPSAMCLAAGCDAAAETEVLGQEGQGQLPPPAAVGLPPDRVLPLSPALHRINVTVSRAFIDDLAAAKMALSHKFPRGGLEEILREGLRLILSAADKRRGVKKRPAAETKTEPSFSSNSRSKAPLAESHSAAANIRPEVCAKLVEQPGGQATHRREADPKTRTNRQASDGASQRPSRPAIPAQVKREVWARDDGRCTFVGALGQRCGSRLRLEFEHLIPVALGGASTLENVTLHCRVHNQYCAERVFGRDKISRSIQCGLSRASAALGP